MIILVVGGAHEPLMYIPFNANNPNITCTQAHNIYQSTGLTEGLSHKPLKYEGTASKSYFSTLQKLSMLVI